MVCRTEFDMKLVLEIRLIHLLFLFQFNGRGERYQGIHKVVYNAIPAHLSGELDKSVGIKPVHGAREERKKPGKVMWASSPNVSVWCFFLSTGRVSGEAISEEANNEQRGHKTSDSHRCIQGVH